MDERSSSVRLHNLSLDIEPSETGFYRATVLSACEVQGHLICSQHKANARDFSRAASKAFERMLISLNERMEEIEQSSKNKDDI